MTARLAPKTRASSAPLHVVRGRRLPRLSVAPWLAFSLVVVVAFFGLVATRTALDDGAFRLAELENQITDARFQNQDLRLDIARLESPARVAELASDLGMTYPETSVMLTVPGVLHDTAPDDPRWSEINRLAAATP